MQCVSARARSRAHPAGACVGAPGVRACGGMTRAGILLAWLAPAVGGQTALYALKRAGGWRTCTRNSTLRAIARYARARVDAERRLCARARVDSASRAIARQAVRMSAFMHMSAAALECCCS